MRPRESADGACATQPILERAADSTLGGLGRHAVASRVSRREPLLSRFAPLVDLVEVVQQVRASRDPLDDKFLEAAVNGRAQAIIAGDKDLLELDPFRGIAIVSPVAYLSR